MGCPSDIDLPAATAGPDEPAVDGRRCIVTPNADLASRADIKRLIDSVHVRVDATLGPILDDVPHTDWTVQLPRMYEFWSTVLFNRGAYRGQPLDVHLALARRVHLGPGEFGRWLELFDTTVDGAFRGPGADDIRAGGGALPLSCSTISPPTSHPGSEHEVAPPGA